MYWIFQIVKGSPQYANPASDIRIMNIVMVIRAGGYRVRSRDDLKIRKHDKDNSGVFDLYHVKYIIQS